MRSRPDGAPCQAFARGPGHPAGETPEEPSWQLALGILPRDAPRPGRPDPRANAAWRRGTVAQHSSALQAQFCVKRGASFEPAVDNGSWLPRGDADACRLRVPGVRVGTRGAGACRLRVPGWHEGRWRVSPPGSGLARGDAGACRLRVPGVRVGTRGRWCVSPPGSGCPGRGASRGRMPSASCQDGSSGVSPAGHPGTRGRQTGTHFRSRPRPRPRPRSQPSAIARSRTLTRDCNLLVTLRAYKARQGRSAAIRKRCASGRDQCQHTERGSL
jgi:hypothetical protein